MPVPIRALELRQLEPKRGRARRYHMAKCHSLFGDLSLLITWGRIGGPTRVRLETFTSVDRLEARWEELLARRIAHGYVTTTTAARESLRRDRRAA
jgi:predicted DNA-binding WGR domain protein